MKKTLLFSLLLYAAFVMADSVIDTVPVIEDELAQFRHPKPVVLDLRAPRKAVLADACPLDSIVGTDLNKKRVSLTEYEYDAAGNTVSETQYTWSGDVKTGVSRYWKQFTGSTPVIIVNFDWDAANQTWIGKDSTVSLFYDNGKQSGQDVYVWENNAWRINTRYEYEYNNPGGQQSLSQYSTWSTTAQSLVYNNKWVYIYGENGNYTEEYWLYNNGWVGSSKKVKEYDAKGNQTLYEEYNGWQNDDWKGKSRTRSEFDANNKETEKYTYKWTSTGWANNYWYSKRYDGNNVIDDATYYWNEKWIGSVRTTKVYDGANVKDEITWEWVDPDWVHKSRVETEYESSKVKSQINSSWNGTDWVKVSKVENTYEAGKISTKLTSRWDGSDWQDSLRTTHAYKGSYDTLVVNAKCHDGNWSAVDSTLRNIIYATVAGKQKITEDFTKKWESKNGLWKGTDSLSNKYDDGGNIIRINNYSFTDGEWVNKTMREYAYKNNNSNLKTLETFMTWSTTKKAWIGTSKSEWDYDETNRKFMTASYTWNTSHNDNKGDWQGLSRSRDVYEGSVKVHSYSDKWDYTAWDWTGMFRYDYTYTAAGKPYETTISRYNPAADTYVPEELTTKAYDNKGRDMRTEKFTWKNDDWCQTSFTETSYDGDAADKLRYTWNIAYTDCEESSSTLLRRYYHCDPKQYTITFNNWNDTALATIVVEEGTTPVYPNEAELPSREADAKFTYTWNGWDPALAPATGNTTYTAHFDETVNKYQISFVNEDNSPLYEVEVAYGETPEYVGETPTKAEDEDFTYAFKDWSPEIEPVTAEATYKAEFTATPKIPTTISNVQTDAVAGKVLLNGTLYITREGNVYTISGQKMNR